MPLTSKLIADFKGAAKSIFDNMVSSEVLGTIYQNNQVDPVTGAYNEGTPYNVRLAVIRVPRNRTSGTWETVGDTVAYVVFDEMPAAILPGYELRYPVSELYPDNINPNDSSLPFEGDIIAGDSNLTPLDFIVAGDSSFETPVTVTENADQYTITGVEVDGAEAAYRLTIRRK